MEYNNVQSEDSSDDEGEVEQEEELEVRCLFCQSIFKSVELAIGHCRTNHNFSIHQICEKFKLDSYGYIKLINYIRSENPDAIHVSMLEEQKWNKDVYLKPYDMNDPWLWYDIDSLNEEAEDHNFPKYVNSENGNVTMSAEHFADLQDTILKLSQEVKMKDEELRRLKEICNELDSQSLPVPSVSNIHPDCDRSYFKSYSCAQVHWEMLHDQIRTCAYQDALMNNADFMRGKTVIDLGCGTGILSLIAVSAGAHKVIAVDESDIIYHTMDVIRVNNMTGKIFVVKGKIEDVMLPISDPVDIIVSEWMGHFLLLEGMLDSVIYTRNKFLKSNGVVLPSRAKLFLMGASNLDVHESYVKAWENVYGYNMNCMKESFIKEAVIESTPPECIITDAFEILTLETKTCRVEDLNFKTKFELRCKKTSKLTHLVGYFDIFFDMEIPTKLTTSPYEPATHWRQTSFFMKSPFWVEEGEILTGEIVCSRNLERMRSLVIVIQVKNIKRTYFLG